MVTGMFNNDNYIVYSVMQCIKLKVVKKWGGLSRPSRPASDGPDQYSVV